MCSTIKTTSHYPLTTRTNDSKDYCNEVAMMKKKTRTRTYIWHMAPIGRCIIHHTRVHHTRHHHKWIITNGCYTVIRVQLFQVIPTKMPPSYYRIFNSITQLYVYTWYNSVVIILGGTDGHGRDNKFKKEVAMIQHTNPLLLIRFVVRTNPSTNNNQQH